MPMPEQMKEQMTASEQLVDASCAKLYAHVCRRLDTVPAKPNVTWFKYPTYLIQLTIMTHDSKTPLCGAYLVSILLPELVSNLAKLQSMLGQPGDCPVHRKTLDAGAGDSWHFHAFPTNVFIPIDEWMMNG